MHTERYTDHSAFCRTDCYQRWLTGWTEPRDSAVDHWVDSEEGRWCHTPRQYALIRVTTRLPFYLLDTLEIGSLACVDIGCGYNWFRQFYPTIWGVDPHSEPYRNELLTPEWYRRNRGQWPRAFSCNAVHFCDQATIAQNIGKVRGILAPGGRAVVTLNRARIRDLTPNYSESTLRHTLGALPGLTRMVWMDAPQEAPMDGNVWLWLEAGAPGSGTPAPR